jgi:hypothetical protein
VGNVPHKEGRGKVYKEDVGFRKVNQWTMHILALENKEARTTSLSVPCRSRSEFLNLPQYYIAITQYDIPFRLEHKNGVCDRFTWRIQQRRKNNRIHVLQIKSVEKKENHFVCFQ